MSPPIFDNPKSLEDLRAEEAEIIAELDKLTAIQYLKWGAINEVRFCKNIGDEAAAAYLHSRDHLKLDLRGVRKMIAEIERK
ncbi:MAG: hypothetical protein WC375_09190 [Methanomassiliicoccales archaeon]|jgi:hypothetical protein